MLSKVMVVQYSSECTGELWGIFVSVGVRKQGGEEPGWGVAANRSNDQCVWLYQCQSNTYFLLLLLLYMNPAFRTHVVAPPLLKDSHVATPN